MFTDCVIFLKTEVGQHFCQTWFHRWELAETQSVLVPETLSQSSRRISPDLNPFSAARFSRETSHKSCSRNSVVSHFFRNHAFRKYSCTRLEEQIDDGFDQQWITPLILWCVKISDPLGRTLHEHLWTVAICVAGAPKRIEWLNWNWNAISANSTWVAFPK